MFEHASFQLVRNWALNRMEEDTREATPKTQASTADDPFLAKFSIVASDAPDLGDQQGGPPQKIPWKKRLK